MPSFDIEMLDEEEEGNEKVQVEGSGSSGVKHGSSEFPSINVAMLG